jgi:hypothetical protein
MISRETEALLRGKNYERDLRCCGVLAEILL